jgi:hypothetical protein
VLHFQILIQHHLNYEERPSLVKLWDAAMPRYAKEYVSSNAGVWEMLDTIIILYYPEKIPAHG